MTIELAFALLGILGGIGLVIIALRGPAPEVPARVSGAMGVTMLGFTILAAVIIPSGWIAVTTVICFLGAACWFTILERRYSRRVTTSE